MVSSIRPKLISTIAVLFLFLFVYTAVSKFLEFSLFQLTLSQSPLIGSLAPVVAVVLPLTEVLLAGLLFFPRTRKAGLYGSFLLMACFTVYIAYMLLFAGHLPCSCGGVLKELSWAEHLVFNGVFTLLAFWGVQLVRESGTEPTQRLEPAA